MILSYTDLFRETQEFYKLPELEKVPFLSLSHAPLPLGKAAGPDDIDTTTRNIQLAPKVKGITGLSVKEILQELVNDGLVKLSFFGFAALPPGLHRSS